MWGVRYADREQGNYWGHLWRPFTTLDHLALQSGRALFTTVQHWGMWGIRVALQTEPENTLGLGLCILKIFWTPFPSVPPGRGESMGEQVHGCTFGGSYLMESAGICTESNSFLFLLLWRVLYSSQGLLFSDLLTCLLWDLPSHLLYLKWELTRLWNLP